MNLKLIARLLAACTLAASAATWAQAFEMDLSESSDKAPPAYRPVLAILGAVSTEGAGDTVTANRAKELEFELVRLAKLNDTFQSVIDPTSVAARLGARKEEALKCDNWACMEKLAKDLGAHRILVASVSKEGIGSKVTLKAYDPSQPELLSGSVDSGEKAERTFAGVGGKSQAQKDKEYLRHVAGFLVTTLGKLTTPNGKIVVDNPEPSAPVNFDGQDVGTGKQEIITHRGQHTIKVSTEAYKPFEQIVTVEPAKDAVVKVTLIAKPLEHPLELQKPISTGPSIATKPGLYVAIAGLAALVVGVVMGQQAMAVSAKAVEDPTTHIVPVTRAQVKDAQGKAVMANVLSGIGAAAMVGGGAWLYVSLASEKKPGGTGGSGEPGEIKEFTLGVGGTF